jgi:hypothetical protein
MPASLALIARAPSPRRKPKSVGPWILLVSALAHGLVLGALVAGVPVMPPLVEPPTLSVALFAPSTTTRTIARPSPPDAAAPARVPAAPAPPTPDAPDPSAPAAATIAPVGVIAPPGFKARALTGGGDALRQAARDGIGCRNADVLALTKAERAACAEALGEQNKNRPAMYAVIDPAKKAAFDGDCKTDDEWCLYRTGKGPYPGFFALGKKKTIKGWD